jgi:hypothetical protein
MCKAPYTQEHLDEEELEVHLLDLKKQVENLKLLIGSVETDLAKQHKNKLVAKCTEAWFMTLRWSLADVKQDTEEAFSSRREFVKLLVEKIAVGRGEDGPAKIDITYRFGPPETGGADSADGVRSLEEFKRAHGRGDGGDLLQDHPHMSTPSRSPSSASRAAPTVCPDCRAFSGRWWLLIGAGRVRRCTPGPPPVAAGIHPCRAPRT